MAVIDCPSQFEPLQGVYEGGAVSFRQFSTGAPYAIRRHKKYHKIIRFELRPGDNGGHLPLVDKVELQQVERFKYRPGLVVWHRWSLMLPEGQDRSLQPAMNGNDWLALGQWHATEDTKSVGRAQDDSLSPPIAYDFSDEALRVYVRSDPHERQSTSRYPEKKVAFSTRDFPAGKWVNFVERIKFDWRGSAEFSVWMDGALIIKSRRGTSIGYNDILMPHYNWGIYRNSGSSLPIIAYYANQEIRFGSLNRRLWSPQVSLAKLSVCQD